MAQEKNKILNVQPHSDEAEQAVLGSMLSSKEAVNKAFEKRLGKGSVATNRSKETSSKRTGCYMRSHTDYGTNKH